MLGKLGFRPNDEAQDWGKKWEAFTKTEPYKELERTGGNTMGVGSFKRVKSPYGCYDTAGNVYEWCADWFKTDYYLLKDAKKNPQGPDEAEAEEVQYHPSSPAKGKAVLLRGGCCRSASGFCRATLRARSSPTIRTWNHGFRVAVSRRP